MATLKTHEVKLIRKFVGRGFEISQLRSLAARKESSMVILYGRRRVGKTELLEQTFKDRNILKFEGIEARSKSIQIKATLEKLAFYTGDSSISYLQFKDWRHVFTEIAKYTKVGVWTLYFEEVQWLANYRADFISELKLVWDNSFRYNDDLILLLCGSSPSFMINKVVNSKALYNRSQHQVSLQPFSLEETKNMLRPGRSNREVLDAYLTVGGIPEYLKRIDTHSSIQLGIAANSFRKDAFFLGEFDRVFTSSLAKNPAYKRIIHYLCARPRTTRNKLAAALKVSPGGGLTELLKDLVQCNLISAIDPLPGVPKKEGQRFHTSDPYIEFYYKFILPQRKQIEQGDFNENPLKALDMQSYAAWLGLQFEKFCRNNSRMIARLLGFEAVKFHSGQIESRETRAAEHGFQIDLAFERADKVLTVCEVKHRTQPVGISVGQEFERKIALLRQEYAWVRNVSIHRVLIATGGSENTVQESGYFDDFIDLDRLMGPMEAAIDNRERLST